MYVLFNLNKETIALPRNSNPFIHSSLSIHPRVASRAREAASRGNAAGQCGVRYCMNNRVLTMQERFASTAYEDDLPGMRGTIRRKIQGGGRSRSLRSAPPLSSPMEHRCRMTTAGQTVLRQENRKNVRISLERVGRDESQKKAIRRDDKRYAKQTNERTNERTDGRSSAVNTHVPTVRRAGSAAD